MHNKDIRATDNDANEQCNANDDMHTTDKKVSGGRIAPDVDEFIRFYDIIKREVQEPFLLLLKPNSKDPIGGVSWKKNTVSFARAVAHMEKGGNLGIAGTPNDGLVIMDKDDIDAVGETKPTLTCTSRKRIGEHCFYVTDEPSATSIFDDTAKMNMATEDAGEIRAVWQYVVAAGSCVPVTDDEMQMIPEDDRHNAGRYSITDAQDMADIKYADIPEVYTKCIDAKRTAENIKMEKTICRREHKSSTSARSALYDVDMHDVMGHIKEGKRFASPFHGSDTGKNTSVINGLINCWRHNVTHTPLTALAIISGVGGCHELGYGHGGHGVSALDMDDGETVFTMWKYAKDSGIIPENDPIPTVALIYYAILNEICTKDDISDGWKLSPMHYRIALAHMNAYRIKHGRRSIRG